MIISLTAVSGWLLIYGYFVLFPLVVIEGPIVTILAGSLVSLGLMNFLIVLAVVVVGDLCGDTIYYFIGRSTSGKFVERWGRYIGITRERVKKLEKHFEKHTGKTLILGKISHGIGGVFLAAAGMAKVPYRKFLWFNFLATVPKSLILILIGYYFGRAYVELSKGIDYISFGVLVIAILLLFGYLIIRHKSQQVVSGEAK